MANKNTGAAATAADIEPIIPEEKSATLTVEVNKDKLDEILRSNEELKKTVDMLLATADKARLNRYQEAQGIAITHTYKVRLFKGQVVTGWRLKEDEMFQDRNGIWHEKQIVEIKTEDGQTYELPYLESEKLEKVLCTFVGKSTRVENGQEFTIFTLRLPEGREINIDPIYVN